MKVKLMMFAGKNVLVTGSARNTGLGIAEVFGGYGATVFVHGRSAEQVAELVQTLNRDAGPAGGRYLPIAADVASEDDVAHAFAFIEQQAGGLDVLVNNACHLGLGYRFLDMPIAFFDEVLAVNLRGYALCAQYAARQMVARGGGAIVNIGSNTARRAGRPRRLYRFKGRRRKLDPSDGGRVGRVPDPRQLRRPRLHPHRALGHAAGGDEAAALEERAAGQGIRRRRYRRGRGVSRLVRKPATSPARRCWFPAASISSWSRPIVPSSKIRT